MKLASAAAAISTLGSLRSFADSLRKKDEKTPLLFIGHGSPMNGIEDNEFSRQWQQMGREITRPTAVLVISAHWLTRGTHITAMEHPPTIHDFRGFPKPLEEMKYPAPGSPQLAKEVSQLIKKTDLGLDHEWGLDHGAWTVVRQMYPDAQIPVLQLSIDYYKPAQYHYDLAKELAALRKKGVMVIGSGNMVHNLGMAQVPGGRGGDFNKEYGFDWAIEMNELFKKNIREGNHGALIDYERLSKSAKLAIPTPDHYYPLLYTLALQEGKEEPVFFNDKAIAGSFTMTSVKIS